MSNALPRCPALTAVGISTQVQTIRPPSSILKFAVVFAIFAGGGGTQNAHSTDAESEWLGGQQRQGAIDAARLLSLQNAGALDFLCSSAGDSVVQQLELELRSNWSNRSSRCDALAIVLASHGRRLGFEYLAVKGAEFDWWLRILARVPTTHTLRSEVARQAPCAPSRDWSGWLLDTSDDALARLPLTDASGFCEVSAGDLPGRDFLSATVTLQEQGDRRRAMRQLQMLISSFPESMVAKRARELAAELSPMLDEDRSGPPHEPLPAATFLLRDCVSHQRAQPGGVRFGGARYEPVGGLPIDPLGVLRRVAQSNPKMLVPLLLDRRLTRCVACPRLLGGAPIVLRNQDAVVEVLNDELPFRPYRGDIFSEEPPEVWRSVASTIRAWQDSVALAPPEDRAWVALRFARMPDRMRVIANAGKRTGDCARAIGELRRLLIDPMYRVWRPEICEQLVALGDRGALESVLQEFDAMDEEPDLGELMRACPDDDARYLNARETIRRLRRLRER